MYIASSLCTMRFNLIGYIGRMNRTSLWPARHMSLPNWTKWSHHPSLGRQLLLSQFNKLPFPFFLRLIWKTSKTIHLSCKQPPWYVLCHEIRQSYLHYDDVIMTTLASQITSLTVVYSIVYSGVDQRKHQSSASLAFVRGIHRDRWIPRTKGQ